MKPPNNKLQLHLFYSLQTFNCLNSKKSSLFPIYIFKNLNLSVNNNYQDQGKAGLALLSNTQNNQIVGYRLLIYVTKTQPIASIKLTQNFKLITQANNYSSFFDESNQPWSVMFDNESSNGQFGTQITLSRLNLMHLTGTFDNNKVIGHDLKVSNEAVLVEANDSIEFTTIVTLWKNMKLDEVS